MAVQAQVSIREMNLGIRSSGERNGVEVEVGDSLIMGEPIHASD